MAHEYLVTRPERPAARHADDARPVAPRLLPAGVRRARHGRLRARPGAVVARRDPARLQRQAARGGLAALRAAAGERDPPRAGARGDGGRPADQRPGGVHARTASSSSGRPTCAASGSPPGFCAHGLAGAGGMGKLVAEWIVEGTPSLDVWHMDSRRFGAAYTTPRVHGRPHDRGLLDLLRRQVPGPRARRPGGRCGSRRRTRGCSELGAAFGEKSGWERANWFEPNAADGDESLRPRGWAGRHWSPAIGAEHRACREAAALFDESSFAKIEVSGAGAAAFLERLCDNRVARDVGAITYTQMLNAKRRDRVRLHRHAARRGALPDRHRHRVRAARSRLDPAARARTTARSPSTTSRRSTPASGSGGRGRARSWRR